MKARDGFVSNSSSSSFMGGIGVIHDWEKFNNWMESLKDLDLDKWSLPRVVDPIVASKDSGFGYSELTDSGDYWMLELPTNQTMMVRLNKEEAQRVMTENGPPDHVIAKQLLSGNPVGTVVYFDISNDEGDTAFYTEPESFEPNYDIDLDWFDDDQQAVYNGFGPENGIVCVDKYFGAGRNG